MIKNPPVNAGDTGDAGSVPRLGRSPLGGNSNPLQYTCLGNSMNSRVCYYPWGCKESDTNELALTYKAWSSDRSNCQKFYFSHV